MASADTTCSFIDQPQIGIEAYTKEAFDVLSCVFCSPTKQLKLKEDGPLTVKSLRTGDQWPMFYELELIKAGVDCSGEVVLKSKDFETENTFYKFLLRGEEFKRCSGSQEQKRHLMKKVYGVLGKFYTFCEELSVGYDEPVFFYADGQEAKTCLSSVAKLRDYIGSRCGLADPSVSKSELQEIAGHPVAPLEEARRALSVQTFASIVKSTRSRLLDALESIGLSRTISPADVYSVGIDSRLALLKLLKQHRQIVASEAASANLLLREQDYWQIVDGPRAKNSLNDALLGWEC